MCGPEGWQDAYRLPQGGFVGRLSVRGGEDWIAKEDGADPRRRLRPLQEGLRQVGPRAVSVRLAVRVDALREKGAVCSAPADGPVAPVGRAHRRRRAPVLSGLSARRCRRVLATDTPASWSNKASSPKTWFHWSRSNGGPTTSTKHSSKPLECTPSRGGQWCRPCTTTNQRTKKGPVDAVNINEASDSLPTLLRKEPGSHVGHVG